MKEAAMSASDATLLDVLVDGFEKNEVPSEARLMP